LALRAGSVGLGHEAGAESWPDWANARRRKAVGVSSDLRRLSIRGLPQLRGSQDSLRPASNSRLRTGTDPGNPTV